MIRLIRNLVIFALFILISIIGLGQCNQVSVHPSKNATYVHHDMCFVDATVSKEEFRTLANWCTELRQKE
jgi:hypothetical protein